jgi:MFS family permease
VLITTAAITAIFSFSYATLLPSWSVTILNGDSTTNGFLQSARGLGSLLAAVTIASLGRIAFKGKLLTTGTLLFPGLILVWSMARWLPLALILLVGVGFFQIIFSNMSMVLMQTHVANELRGRVMSIYSVAMFGMQPIGALMIGGSAEMFGEPFSIALTAIIAVVYAVWLFVRVPSIRALS